MFKLIIADDEPIIRQHLLKAINWESLGFEIVAEASDGLSLLNKTLELSPDAVIIDIKMPIMSGIEFSKKIKETNPNIKIVVLSGYSDSEYLLEMIDSGVFGYILKPFKNEKLTQIFQKLASELTRETLNNNLKNTEAIRLYLRDNNYDNFVKYFNCKDSFFQVFKIFFDEISSLCIDTVTENIFDCLEILLDNYYILEQNISGILCCVPLSDLKEADELINSAFKCINDTVSLIYPDASVSICYIRPSGNWAEIREGMNNFSIYEKTSFLYGCKRIINACELKPSNFSDKIIYSPDTESDIVKALKENNNMSLVSSIKNFHNDLIKNNSSYNGFKQSYFHLVNQVYHILYENNMVNAKIKNICLSIFEKMEKIRFADSIYNFIYNLFMEISENLHSDDSKAFNLYYEQAISFIDQNFMHDITLAQLANYLDISYGYLSSIFKQENDTGFIKLLRNRRIKEAKKLLKDTNMKIYEISDAVGFSNERYFSAIFKKETGMTPLKYRLKNSSILS